MMLAWPAMLLPLGAEVFKRPVTGQFSGYQDAALMPVSRMRGKQHRFCHCDISRVTADQDAEFAFTGEPSTQWMMRAAVDVVFLPFDEHSSAWSQVVSTHGTPASAALVAGFHLVQAQRPPGLELVQACGGEGCCPAGPDLKSRGFDHVVLSAVRCPDGGQAV